MRQFMFFAVMACVGGMQAVPEVHVPRAAILLH